MLGRLQRHWIDRCWHDTTKAATLREVQESISWAYFAPIKRRMVLPLPAPHSVMRTFFLNRWIQVATTSLLALLMLTGLVGCGSGSGSSTTPAGTQTSTSSYWSSVSIGDFGEFNLDLAAGTFVFNFIDSAYGLSGTSIQGTITPDANGTYIGTISGGPSFPIVVKESYAIAALPIDNSGFTPVVSINKSQAITSASQILAATSISSGQFLKGIGYSCQANSQSPINCIASTSIALLMPGANDSEMAMYLCNNSGRQDDNALLEGCYNAYINSIFTSAGTASKTQLDYYFNYLTNSSGTSFSALPGLISNWTATLNPTTNSWDFVDSSNNATIRGVFATDSSSGNLIGFLDTVNASGIGYSGFQFFTNMSQALTETQVKQLSAPSPQSETYSNVFLKSSGEYRQVIGRVGGPTVYGTPVIQNLKGRLQFGGSPIYENGLTRSICATQNSNPLINPYTNSANLLLFTDLYSGSINSNQLQVGGPLGGPTPMAGFLSIPNPLGAVETAIYIPGNDDIGIGFSASTVSTPALTTAVNGTVFKFFYTTKNQGNCY